MPTSRKKGKTLSGRQKTKPLRDSIPAPIPVPVKKAAPVSLKQEKAKSLLQQQRTDLSRLVRQLEYAGDPEDLNKFTAFDFPVAVKRYGDHQTALMQLLDDHTHFPIKFSQLYSPIHQMNTSIGRAQTSLSELHLASIRKEPFHRLRQMSQRIQLELEMMRQHTLELERILSKLYSRKGAWASREA